MIASYRQYQHLYLLSLGQFSIWYCLCAYISLQETFELGQNESPMGRHCVISPPVYRILEAFPVKLVPICIVCHNLPLRGQGAVYRLQSCTLQSGSTLHTILFGRLGESLRTVNTRSWNFITEIPLRAPHQLTQEDIPANYAYYYHPSLLY